MERSGTVSFVVQVGASPALDIQLLVQLPLACVLLYTSLDCLLTSIYRNVICIFSAMIPSAVKIDGLCWAVRLGWGLIDIWTLSGSLARLGSDYIIWTLPGSSAGLGSDC